MADNYTMEFLIRGDPDVECRRLDEYRESACGHWRTDSRIVGNPYLGIISGLSVIRKQSAV